MYQPGHRPWTQSEVEFQPREAQSMMGGIATMSRRSRILFCVGHQSTGNQALGSSLHKALLLGLIPGDQGWPQGSVQAPPCQSHPSSFQPKPLGRSQVLLGFNGRGQILAGSAPTLRESLLWTAWVCTLCEFQHSLFCFYPSCSVWFPLMALVS